MMMRGRILHNIILTKVRAPAAHTHVSYNNRRHIRLETNNKKPKKIKKITRKADTRQSLRKKRAHPY